MTTQQQQSAMSSHAGWRFDYAYPLPETLRTHSLLFSVICLYSILNVAFSPLRKKREISLTATFINASGCISYLIMGNSWLPMLYTHDGWPFLLIRSLEWCVTVPVFLRMLAQLIDPQCKGLVYWQWIQSIALLIGCLISMIIPKQYLWFCFVAAVVLQAHVLVRINAFLIQMEAAAKDSKDRLLMLVIHIGILILFILYPLVWYMGVMTHQISPEQETFLFAWLDIVTKFVFTSVLCNLTTRAFDMNVVGCSEQFWKFIRVVELPVFALSKDRRIVFWNPGMEDLTKVGRQSVMYRRLEQLSEVFPEDTRDSLMYLGDSEDNLKHNDVRYEIPFYVGGQRDRPKTSTFSVLANHLEEVAIPKVVFVGSPPSEQERSETDSTAFVQLAYYLHNPDGAVNQPSPMSSPKNPPPAQNMSRSLKTD